MSSLLQVVPAAEHPPVWGWVRVRALVIDSVSSRYSRRVYARALDDFRAWSQHTASGIFTRETVQQYRAHLESRATAPARVNLHLTVLRKLAREAASNGILASDTAEAQALLKARRAGDGLQAKRDRALLGMLTRKRSPIFPISTDAALTSV